ncbi:creatininase family protein [Sorangium sp. So ce448]|uniref:creatininase family protein n=1 Tax=Sorangium sp. So ce448 TaxID=3133314 RepID=UPI003F5E0552
MQAAPRLAELTTEELAALLAGGAPCVALVPVGSVEPHGPHLPLGTDTFIGEAAAEQAGRRLWARGVAALLAPPVGYGVTDFAAGFAGAISIPAPALTAFLRAVAEAYLSAGLSHVCFINNHLEPEHDRAVRAATSDLPLGRASVACPLARRWARTLSAEFRSGACHAGRYETSLVLAAASALVRKDIAQALPDVGLSLSEGIKAGAKSFRALGMDAAYTGSPREASEDEGRALLDLLATMIVTEVEEGLSSASSHEPPPGKSSR